MVCEPHFQREPDYHADLERVPHRVPDSYHFSNNYSIPHSVQVDSAGHSTSCDLDHADAALEAGLKTIPLILNDATGGLNDAIHPAGIAANQLSKLENYYTDEKGVFLRKRKGKELIQYAPIDPQPFTTDGDTKGLWHLEESATPYDDVSANNKNFNSSLGTVTAVTGLFSNGQTFLRPQLDADGLLPDGVTPEVGSVIWNSSVAYLNGLSAVCFEAWVKLDGSMTGKPTSAGFQSSPANVVSFSDSGAALVATCRQGIASSPGQLYNGLSVCRDWDSTNNTHAGNPYFKLTIKTAGVAGTETIIRSNQVDFGRWYHVKGQYDSATGVMEIFVNGDSQATATPVGGGVIDDALSRYIVAGGCQDPLVASPSALLGLGRVFSSVQGTLDECRISSVTRAAFPFKKPRGMGFEYAGSDGTRQSVVSAEGGLYYTVGNTEWTLIQAGFSEEAYWDAVFVKDKLYLANGVDNNVAWDSDTLVTWGNPAVPPVLVLSAGTGVTAGTRRMAFTYVYGDVETGMSPYAEIENPGGNQIDMTGIPSRHSNATAVRAYATKPGDNDTWYLYREIPHDPNAEMQISGLYTAGSPAGYLTDTGGFGPADADLGGSDYPEIASVVQTAVTPKPRFLLAEHNRVFGCGILDRPYDLLWTELATPDAWRVFNFCPASANKGPLIALASFYGEIQASKSGNATLILRGDNPQNWAVFETLHQDVGCIDHWGYVRRYLEDTDRYVLAFPGRDGFYEYAGQSIRKVSKDIQKTVDRLVQNNSTRLDWTVTTQAQFQAQPFAGGSAALNVLANKYDRDGLRETPGRAGLTNQLDYIGLWEDSDVLVSGKVIAVCKGAAEGEFWFSDDASNDLWHTTDNFQTKASVAAVGGGTERIIEIVAQAADDIYWLLTDTENADGKSSDGGFIYTWDNGAAALNPIYGTKLYYDLDIPVWMESPGGNAASGRTIGRGVYQLTGSPNNIFLNHAQTLRTLVTVPTINTGGFVHPNQTVFSNPSIQGAFSSIVFNGLLSAGSNANSLSLGIGFYAFETQAPSGGTNISSQSVQYTRREFPFWRGGTFRPQAYWDSTNGRLVFLASTAEDGNGNRSTYLRTLTSAGALVNQYTAQNVTAWTTDGTSIWMQTIIPPTSAGFDGAMRQSTLATPGTIVSSAVAPNYAYTYAIRLSYNSQNTASLLGSFKYMNTGVQEFWTYQSRVQKVTTATLLPTLLGSLTANGDSGPVAKELAVQTTTPYAWFLGIDRITENPVYTVPSAATSLSVFEADAYDEDTVGIYSNLLFVPASDAAGGNLWADRLYWSVSRDTDADGDVDDAKLVQRGVPGTWTVIGTFASEAHNFGAFSAFDTFNTDFSNGSNVGGVAYEFRNAADPAALALATYQPVVANQKLAGFIPVAAYGQWRATYTWNYAVAAVTTAPYVSFVSVGYFLGAANLPRITGIHFGSRTYWTCAEDGATENNVVLVYQKNNTWTKHYGWNLKSMWMFRDQLTALEAYQYVRLESGTTDMGALIAGKARTGYIMGLVDKMISAVQANVLAFVNNLFANRPGYVKITPYQADEALTDGAWVVEIPDSDVEEPRRILGVPAIDFSFSWARAFAIEVSTSEDTTGDWVPYLGQPEEIQAIDLKLDVTEESYDIPVR